MSTPPDPGSFRDPLSRVYVDREAVWRGLSDAGLADFEAYAATDAYRAAQADGRLVATTAVPVAEAPIDGSWAGALRHDRVRVITYPYEWTFAMLRDAALLQLDLSRAALAEGVLTKDATSYNVQFDGSRPVFIDVGSFERLVPGEPWAGYRQFCELFLNPLYLQAAGRHPVPAVAARVAQRHLPHPSPQPPSASGSASAATCSPTCGSTLGPNRTTPTPTPSTTCAASSSGRASVPRSSMPRWGTCRGPCERLEWKSSASTWSSYSKRGHYTDADLDAKADFVARATSAIDAPIVLDLGANDGRFSRVAVEAGASLAIAVDGDHLVVDHLYRQLRADGERRILPLVLDLADPSPGLGWRSRERPSFVDRVRPDLVLCLAVIHHLALSNTVPFDEIVAFLHDFGATLVVEMPHRDDPMAARLLGRKRAGLFDHYDRPQWEAALGRRFTVLEQVTLPSGTRTLYLCRPT